MHQQSLFLKWGQPRDLEEYRKYVFTDIGVRPMIICSDNHDARNYDPAHKLWIKADVTFNGLKQIMYEPEERVRISESIPDYKPNYYIIDSIAFKDDYFQTHPIKFSKNLTCVIGGKSTGKSILLHNLARTIDKEQVKQKEDISKTSTKNVNEITVLWADGKSDENRKIVYIPQTYLNRLSDERESTTEIDTIIENVVLIDDEIRKSHEKMLKYIKENKKVTNQTILELLSNHAEISSINNSKKELGNRKGIENEIKVLKKKKDDLSKTSELSESELQAYENAIQKIKELSYQINNYKEEIEHINNIDSIVEQKELDYLFSDYTTSLINKSINATIDAANLYWKSEKVNIVESIKSLLSENENDLCINKEIIVSLKDKVTENKSVTELSEKIQIEVNKLEQFIKLDKEEDTLIEKEKLLIDKLCNSIVAFKEIQNEYAKMINDSSTLTSNNLEFSVDVPFKKDAFIAKLSMILNNRISLYRELVNPDDFSEENYTSEWLHTIIINLLNKQLQTKSGYSNETALREIFDNWYSIKYNIKMDNDTIDVMSPGKKALVLLKLLIDLAESKCPILIDQPEDDLDNRSIFEDLIPFIKKKKKDRQIIIVTHNANVVLGSDAEEVIVANQQGNNVPNKQFRFEYRSGSIENDTSVYDDEGEIDKGILNSQGIQQHICDILEGGEKAFELRKKKYHI